MKRKLLFIFPFMFIFFMLLSANAHAMSDSDIEIIVISPVNDLGSENGVIAVEHFPAKITVLTTAKAGNLTAIQAAFDGKTQEIEQNHVIIIQNKEDCGIYTITAQTDKGAVLTISVNVVFQVQAIYNIRYRTLGINLKGIYDDHNNLIKVFQLPQLIKLDDANTIAENEKEHIAELIDTRDGKTYTLKGSLFVEVYDFSTGRIISAYDVDEDYGNLISKFNWTPKTIDAYKTMRDMSITYQAPVKININAAWCSGNKQEVYGKLTAKDKGVPEYLYPYKTTSVTFSKDDIPLSRNLIYKGMEWNYSPETEEYIDGESETNESITQKINYMTPAADFYFKFNKRVDPDNPPIEPDNPPKDPEKDPEDPEDPPAVPDKLPKDPDKPPIKPDKPPVDPDIPVVKLCDLSAHISSPKEIYEQEEYSFTVYFVNHTDKDITGVRLKATIDNMAAAELPLISSFKPDETKIFNIKRKAGAAGTSIKLETQVSPPQEFKDTDISNNTAKAEIQVVERPYDLDVQRITPDIYKENQTVITTIKVSNKGSLDFTPGQKVTVLFEVPELSISKRVNSVVMESNTHNIVSVKWNTPNVTADKNITLIATINPDNSLSNEISFENNIYKQKAVIQNVIYKVPNESKSISNPPRREENPRITWREQRFENGRFVWRSFYAELKVNATIDYDTKAKGYIKSGYGFTIKVTTSVATNYDMPELITAPQTAEVYLLQHRYQTAIPLMAESKNSFTFRENPESPYRYKKQYVPVWFPDNRDYIIQLLVTDVHTPGGTLSKWITGGNLKIKVVDSMYSDDVTTGS